MQAALPKDWGNPNWQAESLAAGLLNLWQFLDGVRVV